MIVVVVIVIVVDIVDFAVVEAIVLVEFKARGLHRWSAGFIAGLGRRSSLLVVD